jgi:hypothetical protein
LSLLQFFRLNSKQISQPTFLYRLPVEYLGGKLELFTLAQFRLISAQPAAEPARALNRRQGKTLKGAWQVR